MIRKCIVQMMEPERLKLGHKYVVQPVSLLLWDHFITSMKCLGGLLVLSLRTMARVAFKVRLTS
jgi:hypothetical protein